MYGLCTKLCVCMVNKSDPGYLYTVFYFEHVQLLMSKFDTTFGFSI